MDVDRLVNEIAKVEFTRVKLVSGAAVEVFNMLEGYSALIDSRRVVSTRFVESPFKQVCLQIFYADGGLIISPNDFVFDVKQDELVRVDNLPAICSVREMVQGLDAYLSSPNPSENLDLSMGLYCFHYYIVKSALRHGFPVDGFVENLKRIGEDNGFWGLGSMEIFS